LTGKRFNSAPVIAIVMSNNPRTTAQIAKVIGGAGQKPAQERRHASARHRGRIEQAAGDSQRRQQRSRLHPAGLAKSGIGVAYEEIHDDLYGWSDRRLS
jgi:hypothetical protein